MERLINRRQQGDIGEASAVEWLLSKGAAVFLPFGHSPDFDLIAEIGGILRRVQVKTSTQVEPDASGTTRYSVSLKTCGGNQSWTGVSKNFDPARVDYLLALTAHGRRWFIPTPVIDGATGITLGGPKYAEYEIEPGSSICEAVFGESPALESESKLGEYPRGQRMAAVNGPAQPSQVRLLPPPLASSQPVKPSNYERKPGQQGFAVINQKRRITILQRPFFEAGLANGGKVRVRSDGPGRIVIEQVELPDWAQPQPEARAKDGAA